MNILTKEDIIHEGFDREHYTKVRHARHFANEAAGEVIYPMFEDLYPENGRIFNHDLEGATLYDKEKDRTMTIESVHRHWYYGWYKMILSYTEYVHLGEVKRSHATLFWENENCTDDIILESIGENNERYTVKRNTCM